MFPEWPGGLPISTFSGGIFLDLLCLAKIWGDSLFIFAFLAF